jgi:hypothetical protein
MHQAKRKLPEVAAVGRRYAALSDLTTDTLTR